MVQVQAQAQERMTRARGPCHLDMQMLGQWFQKRAGKMIWSFHQLTESRWVVRVGAQVQGRMHDCGLGYLFL